MTHRKLQRKAVWDVIRDLYDENQRLRAIVERLPVYADTGEPFVPRRDSAWLNGLDWKFVLIYGEGGWVAHGDPTKRSFYSTLEAAESARKTERATP